MDYSLLVGLHFRDENRYDKMGLSPFLLRSGKSSDHLHNVVMSKIYAGGFDKLKISCFILQVIKILIRMRSLCVAVAFLKQSCRTWIEFWLASMFLVPFLPSLFCH